MKSFPDGDLFWVLPIHMLEPERNPVPCHPPGQLVNTSLTLTHYPILSCGVAGVPVLNLVGHLSPWGWGQCGCRTDTAPWGCPSLVGPLPVLSRPFPSLLLLSALVVSGPQPHTHPLQPLWLVSLFTLIPSFGSRSFPDGCRKELVENHTGSLHFQAILRGDKELGVAEVSV